MKFSYFLGLIWWSIGILHLLSMVVWSKQTFFVYILSWTLINWKNVFIFPLMKIILTMNPQYVMYVNQLIPTISLNWPFPLGSFITLVHSWLCCYIVFWPVLKLVSYHLENYHIKMVEEYAKETPFNCFIPVLGHP